MIICIIPARFNSSRFPGKLLAIVEGKTILQHTYECAKKATSIDKLLIATDHPQIASEAESFGAQVIWTDEQCASGTDRIIDALQREKHLQQADIVINLQGDHPATRPSTIDHIARLLKEDPSVPVATPVRLIRSWDDFQSPHVVKCVFDQNQNALYFSRSPIPHTKIKQDPPCAYQHIGIYGYRTSFLLNIPNMQSTPYQKIEDLEQLRFMEFGFRIKIAIVEDEAIGIDTPNDLKQFNQLLRCRQNTFS